jgi:tripartite-type tricarboxylate transporter receptor subunit TctC
MVTEYFLDTAGASIVHVPYKGTAPALSDTISGSTQLVFGTVGSTLPFVNSGQLRALAVTTPARLKALPNVPTVAESGYANWTVTNWHGLIAPKGLPRDIQMKLNKVVNDSLRDPEIARTLAKDGLTAAGGTPEEFQALLTSEVARWGALAKKRNIKVD